MVIIALIPSSCSIDTKDIRRGINDVTMIVTKSIIKC